MRRKVRFRDVRLAIGAAAVAVVLAIFLLVPRGSQNSDVVVSISGVPDYIFLDQPFDLTITYENRGNDRSYPVALSIHLPASFEIQRSTQATDHGRPAATWQLPGLLPGEQGFITLTLKGLAPDPGASGDYEYGEGYVAFEDGFEVTVRAHSAKGSLLDEAHARADTGICVACQYVVNLSWRIAGNTPGAAWSLLRTGPGEIASGPVVYSSTADYTDGGGGSKGLLDCETDYEYVLRVAVGNRVVSTQPIVGRTGDCLKMNTMTTISDTSGNDVFVSVESITPNSGTPTGTVEVTSGSATCTFVLENGFGRCRLSSLSSSITARYLGDATFNPSSVTQEG